MSAAEPIKRVYRAPHIVQWIPSRDGDRWRCLSCDARGWDDVEAVEHSKRRSER